MRSVNLLPGAFMNIIGKRNFYYILSGLLVVPGIIALFLWGLKFGIDFKGGTLLEVQYNQNTSVQQVRDSLKETGKNFSVQPSGANDFLLRGEPLSQEQHNQVSASLKKAGEYKEVRFETVGPTVSNDLKNKAIWAVIIASLAIILYIAYAFRSVPKPASSWRFGVSAVLALIHDLAFVAGIFAILGHFFHYEVDSLFITALLTIMGFSVHDTIVVFDRIRENLRKHPSYDFETNVNNSIIQTLNRSLNTSLTVLIVLAAMVLLGGKTIQPFILALLVGIAIGTYSSIFFASPLLVSWQRWTSYRTLKKNAS